MTEWNKLEHFVTNAPTPSSFKSRYTPNPTYKNNLFYYGPRFENVQLARMRIGCSSLESHLCHNLHVEDNPSCNCGHLEETIEHLFQGCPLYYEQRRVLFNVLDQESTTTHSILSGNITIQRLMRISGIWTQYINTQETVVISELV